MKPNWFFRKTYKINKQPARLIKDTNHKYQRVATTIDIKRMVKKYYEQLHANKFNNSDKMGKFLERHNEPKNIQEETNIQVLPEMSAS